MRVMENGVYRDMTAEEMAALQNEQEEQVVTPTLEERLEALESAMLEQLLGE